MAFTEQGVAMLSGILNSDRAIEVNIQIMRAFVQLRHVIADHAELKRALDELRNQTEEQFQVVFTVLDQLVSHSDKAKRKIGFIEDED
jgi:ferritin-like metal-binding protein YciE